MTSRLRLEGPAGAAVLGLLGAQVLFLAVGLFQGVWLVDSAGAPLCRDFSVFWASGRLASQGLADQAYSLPQVRALLTAEGQAPDCVLPMLYPPQVLLLLAPFGVLPYAWAAAAWIAISVTVYAAAVRLATPRPMMVLLALAAPAVTACLSVGQNGLITAALALAGLAFLDRRPVLAGVLLGALAYKPQFGLLFPIALIATGRWKTFAAAAATVAASAAAALIAFGWTPFLDFAQTLGWARSGVMEAQGMAAFKQQSVLAAAQTLGLTGGAAWAAQGAMMLAAAAGVVWLWRGACPPLRAGRGAPGRHARGLALQRDLRFSPCWRRPSSCS